MDRLEHIHAALAAALRMQRDEEPFDAPVTVAEIYQDLVPYRSVRTQLGFDMNADYEHTLLRLLAGEGELARLEPVEARAELRKELGMPNPNVGLFRKFAACDVWVVRPGPNAPVVNVRRESAPVPEPPPTATANGTSESPPAPAADEPEPTPIVDAPEPDGVAGADAWSERSALWMDPPAEPAESESEMDALELQEEGFELLLDDAIEIGDAEASPKPAAPAANPTPTMKESAVATTEMERATGTCAFCDSGLPSGRTVKYCPFCGMDQTLVPCGSCGEALDPGWRYCIACGADGPGTAS